MGATKSALAIPLGCVAIVVFVPRFTARQVEAYRNQQFFRQSAQGVDRACPAGDERDALFAPRFDVHTSWIPVCRELPPPAGKVIIEHESRPDYAHCREQLQEQSQADCFLNEPLSFLVDDKPRTVARMKVGDVIWVTPRPLAWGDHLVDEHRAYVLLLMCCAMLCSLMSIAGRRAREIYLRQRRCRVGPVPIPVWAEFWVLFFEHPYAQSFVVDLQDEYERWLHTEGKKNADALCWLHVRRSLPALILVHIQGWLPVLGRLVR